MLMPCVEHIEAHLLVSNVAQPVGFPRCSFDGLVFLCCTVHNLRLLRLAGDRIVSTEYTLDRHRNLKKYFGKNSSGLP